MLIDEEVEIKWSAGNKEYYENKGYKFTGYRNSFTVNVKDLKTCSKARVDVKCDYCGRIVDTSFQAYVRGHKTIAKDSCANCVGLKCAEITLSKRKKNLYGKLITKSDENGYSLLSSIDEIINNRTRVKYLCPKHGVQHMALRNYLSGRKCPMCELEHRREIYRQDIDVVKERITKCGGVLLNPEDYINNATKNLHILCPECGEPFVTSLRAFTQHGGQVCQECGCKSESIGEKKIRYYLSNHNIDFYQEYWFPDCRDVNPLPFDFYVPSRNLIIEFDGRQHFSETNYFSYSYAMTQKHDQIKAGYLSERGINLVRIQYYNINKIDEILDNIFT